MRLDVFGAAVMAILLALAGIVTAAEPTLLDAAEAGDRVVALRLLAAKGTDPNKPGPDGTTPIMYAAANGDVELVRALIKAGANVKLKNQLGTTAITVITTASTPLTTQVITAAPLRSTSPPCHTVTAPTTSASTPKTTSRPPVRAITAQV